MKPYVVPHALTQGEIAGILADYRRAATHARQAGFDGVELHGANGYLIDQFLRDKSNQRSDRYGGSALNRARFLIEATQALIAEWGAARVGVRLSPTNPFNDMGDSDPGATFATAVRELAQLDIGYLHIVEPDDTDPVGAGERPGLSFFRRLWRGPLMANKGYDLARANAVLHEGKADLISFATLYLANPDLPERLRRGGPFNAADRKTFYGGGAAGYTDYPPLGN
jgi:N-ethylmaleimide reductase